MSKRDAPSIALCASIWTCRSFETRESGESGRRRIKVSVVLAPIRVTNASDGAQLIAWGCNRAKFCVSDDCLYAKGDEYVAV